MDRHRSGECFEQLTSCLSPSPLHPSDDRPASHKSKTRLEFETLINFRDKIIIAWQRSRPAYKRLQAHQQTQALENGPKKPTKSKELMEDARRASPVIYGICWLLMNCSIHNTLFLCLKRESKCHGSRSSVRTWISLASHVTSREIKFYSFDFRYDVESQQTFGKDEYLCSLIFFLHTRLMQFQSDSLIK